MTLRFGPMITRPDRQDDALDAIVPENPNKPYDMRDIITRVDKRPLA